MTFNSTKNKLATLPGYVTNKKRKHDDDDNEKTFSISRSKRARFSNDSLRKVSPSTVQRIFVHQFKEESKQQLRSGSLWKSVIRTQHGKFCQKQLSSISNRGNSFMLS